MERFPLNPNRCVEPLFMFGCRSGQSAAFRQRRGEGARNATYYTQANILVSFENCFKSTHEFPPRIRLAGTSGGRNPDVEFFQSLGSTGSLSSAKTPNTHS